VGRFAAVMAGLAASALVSSAAAGASLTNRDERDYKVTIIEGESSREHTLRPAGVLDGICQKGCVIRLNDSEEDEYELEGDEVVSIEDGSLYYDGPDTPGDMGSGEGEKPPKQ
jgi:hypothetical protein